MDYESQLEHYSLRWNNFNDNMKTGFHDLLRREDFVDVTIAAEGKLIHAHKMVLSICSPYFKNIFKTNPCQHPIVFLKDVTHKELSGILQFMYLGEVSVRQKELGRFLKTAEALQIKGLSSEDKVISSNNEEQKEQSKYNGNGTNKNKAKILPFDLSEKQESKKMKMNFSTNGLSWVNSQVPVTELPVEVNRNHVAQESEVLLKSEPPELDFYDIECGRESSREENSTISDYQSQDNYFEKGDEMTDSKINGSKPGIGQDLNDVQGFIKICKPVEENQGSRTSPVLRKNQGLCPICGRILQHKKNLQTHIVDQHSGIFGCWPCQICHKVCRTWSALRVHTNRHHMKLDPGPVPFFGVTQQTN